LGCWILPCYDPYSFGAHFETYKKLFYFFHFKFFSDYSKQRITEAMDTESADTGAQPYIGVDDGTEGKHGW
jgi:hypothetical protein